MNIIRLNNDKIDKRKWDERITHSSFPSIYALSWYLDTVSPNWEALISDDYEYVFPLTVKKKWKSVKYIGVPNFCQQLGLFSIHPIDESALLQFLDAIPKTYIRKDIPLNHSNPMIESLKKRDNFILNVSSISEVRAKYSSQTKRNLKKGKNNHLTVKRDVDFQQLIELFKDTKGKTIQKVDYSILENLCKACSAYSILHTYAIYDESELISGALFFEFNKRWYMMLLASSAKGKDLLAATVLIDHALERISERKMTLDFEGSSIPSLARFYKGFGGMNEAYHIYTKRLV